MENAKGTVIRYEDNVDTDVIIPARYLATSDPAELAKHCMEDIDPDFGKKIKKGDIIVGNSKANKYGITKEGWVGVVVQVFDDPLPGEGCDDGIDVWFRAKTANYDGMLTFALDQNAFDLA